MTKREHLAAIESLPVLCRHDDFGNVISVAIYRHTPFEDIKRDAYFFAGQGYVVIVQDTRGKHESEGVFKVSAKEALDGFDTVTSSCPVPIVMAGGKKIPELDALKMAYNAIQQGASGVDMGRNIFQSDSPVAMLQAVRAVVHDNETPEKALDLYSTIKDELPDS